MQGIIEGFGAPEWSPEARSALLAFAGRHGLDAYVYASDDDGKRQADWRTPYAADDMARLGAIAAAAREGGLLPMYGIAPGADAHFADVADFRALSGKVAQLRGAGFDGVLLDLQAGAPVLSGEDLTRFGGDVAAAHAYAANWLFREQRTLREPFRLILLPREHAGASQSPYLSTLREQLNRQIDVAWTGPGADAGSQAAPAAAHTIASGQARAYGALVGRPPVLLDVWPSNAHEPERLFLGPVAGRAADLPRSLRGLLMVPMRQALASLVPVATYAAYLADPRRYEPEAALRAAVAEVGGPAAEALGYLCDFQRRSAVDPLGAPDARLLEWMAIAARATQKSSLPALDQVGLQLGRVQALLETLGGTAVPGLAEEVAPWAAKLAQAAGLARQALVGGDPAAMRQELQELRSKPEHIGGPLLDFVERIMATGAADQPEPAGASSR